MKFPVHRAGLGLPLLSAVTLLFANVFLFSTYAVYRSNPAEFEVGYLDMLASQAYLCALAFVALALPGLIPNRGFALRYVSVVFMLGVLTWLQSSVFLGDYGVFDGRETAWTTLDAYGWLDLAVWACLLVVAVRYAGQVVKIVGITAGVLLAGQFLVNCIEGGWDREGFWTKAPTLHPPDGLFDVSAASNVFHIVMDSFQTDVFIDLMAQGDLRRDFQGFTVFRENAGVTPDTSLAIPAVLSGEIFDGSQTAAAYYRSGIDGGFQNVLYSAGYTVNLMPLLSMVESSYSNYFEIPSNYRGTPGDLKLQNAAQLLDVALFRDVPHFLRKRLYREGNWLFLSLARRHGNHPSFREKRFLQDYIGALRIGGEAPAYHFLHVNAPHPPYVTLQDGSYAGRILENTRENYLNESRAILGLVGQLLQKLEELGVYEDTLVVLQGDHGSQINPVIDGREIEPCLRRLPALLAIKPPRSKAPLAVSHSFTTLLDIAPTVLRTLGHEGVSVFERDFGPARSRPFVLFDNKRDEPKIVRYEIHGSVFDPESCVLVSESAVAQGSGVYQFGTKLVFGMMGNADFVRKVGWGTCQADHCWSNREVSSLSIPVPAVDTDLSLSFRVIPFVSKPKVPQQSIVLSVNGHEIGEWLATSRRIETYRATIPAQLLQGGPLYFEFRLPDAVQPKALGLGGDQRTLGIALLSMQIDQPDAAGSAASKASRPR